MRQVAEQLALETEAAAAARGRLLDHVSIEATPKQIAGAEGLLSDAPAGLAVYVPSLPGRDLAESVAACRRLAALGHQPTPHLPARVLRDAAHLDEILGRLRAAGATQLLLIAGDAPRPAGAFASTLDVLETGLLERHGFQKIGFAGHPEGHPTVDAESLDEAIDAKLAWAQASGAEIWLATQFVFEADPIAAWEKRLRDRGARLPVRVGVPGPARIRTLLSYALSCGVAASARMLAARPDAARLLGRWTPDALLDGLERHRAAARESLLAGAHFFPFGGLEATLSWMAEAQSAAADRTPA